VGIKCTDAVRRARGISESLVFDMRGIRITPCSCLGSTPIGELRVAFWHSDCNSLQTRPDELRNSLPAVAVCARRGIRMP